MRPPRIWVTRPQADAAGLAEALRQRGFEPVIEPLLLVELTDGPPLPLDGVQALLATSANGARALARRTAERRLPLLAVGDGTARIARKLGFEAVESAGGDVASLAERICLRLDPVAGAVLHAAGTEVAGDLGGTLQAAGFRYRREVVYRVDTPERLTDALVARWAADDIDGVVVFSPRTGRTLVRLLRQSGQADASRHAVCFCLSEAVVTTVSTLRWHRIRVAAQPTQAALLDEVVAEAAHRAGATGGNCLSSKADFAVTLGATANCTRTGVGAMSSDSKQEQQPGKAAGTSEASKSTPGATPAATPDTAPAATTPPAAATPKVQATDPQPQGASPTTAGPTESGRPRTGEGRAGGGTVPASAAKAASDSQASKTPDSKTPGSKATTSGPPEPKAPPKRGGSGALLWVFVLIVLLAAGGAAAWFLYLEPRLQQMAEAQQGTVQPEVVAALDDLDARVVGLRQQLDGMAPRLDTLERALASLEQSVAQMDQTGDMAEGGTTDDGATPDATTQDGGENVAVTEQDLQEVNDRLAMLESQAAAASGLAEQVHSLEAWTAITRDNASKVAATVLAVGQLTQTIDGGGPFVRPLATVRSLGGDDADIAQAAAELEPWAADGIATLSELRGAFPATADAIVRSEPVTDGSRGWTDRVIEQMASLVSVRRTGPEAMASGGVDGTVAKAQQALDAGDLRAAVDALKSLEGPPAQAAQSWLDTAEQKLAAEQALANLQQRAIARLSAAKG